ncbi:MAG: 50S ribosomal protein L25/general stress protein Ctc [Janthinobacterium lividum]
MKVVAFERSEQGTGASRRLRRAGKTPGIVYGATSAPRSIELDHNALFHALRKEAFHASILELEIAGKAEQVLLRDVQYHPFKPMILHIDFQRVDASVRLHTKVPLHFMNQENSPAVKLNGGILMHVLNELEISCLPADLPEFVEVDVAAIEVGQSLHVKDIKLPAGVELVPHLETENPVFLTAVQPAVTASDAAEDAAAAAGDAAPAA